MRNDENVLFGLSFVMSKNQVKKTPPTASLLEEVWGAFLLGDGTVTKEPFQDSGIILPREGRNGYYGFNIFLYSSSLLISLTASAICLS